MIKFFVRRTHWIFWMFLLTNVAWAQDRAPDYTPSLSTVPPGQNVKVTSLTEKEREKELAEWQKAAEAFQEAALDYLREVRSLVQKQYRERRRLIEGGYDTKLKRLEERENLIRQTAIQRFLAFIKKYPNHPKFTPDAMYRLAELYYESEYNLYLARASKYDKDMQRYDNKEISEEPIAPKRQFPQTIYWLLKITKNFPNYRFIAGAYYLLGYCKKEEDKEEEAVKYFKIITERFPKDHLVTEAWIRLGQYYFSSEQRQKAKAAYSKVLEHPNHPMFDKALYKLAWTHYLLDEFDLAVKRFTQLLEYYLKKGGNSGGDLRKEAIQYIAISFADDKWGSPEKAKAYVLKQGLEKPYSRDVLIQLAKNYKTQQNWEQVIAVDKILLSLYPYHPKNPLVQEQIIMAYEQLRKLELASAERNALIKNFGPHSKWFEKNAHNPRAQRMVDKILSKSIYKTAIYNHESCTSFRKHAEETKDPTEKQNLESIAKKYCFKAAENYQKFLKRFPHHKDSYELTWYLADTLYFIERYEDAAKYFKKVRDWPNEKRFFQEAAFSLIDSYVKMVASRCRQGKIKRACEGLPEDKTQPKANKKQASNSGTILRRRKIIPLPIPELQKKLLVAREFFLQNVKDKKDSRIPAQMYLMARIYYAYDHIEKARALLWKFIRKYPQHKLVQEAGDSIVASYRREGRLHEMLAAITELRRTTGTFKAPYEKKLRVGVAYIDAKRLQKQKKWVAAAKAYELAVSKNPRHKDAPAALWNAALMYEKANRYGSALRIYERIVREYPSWNMADQALFFVAYNAEKYFNFDKAVSRYMQLVNDRHFRNSKKRADALYNAALLLENLQRYDEAAKAYLRYARIFKDKPDAPEMFYRATRMYKKMERWDDFIRSLKAFIRRYSRDPKQARRVMMAYGEIMNVYEKQGKPWRFMEREYKKVIKAFDQLSPKMQPVDIALTRRYPAKALFRLAMKLHEKFMKFKIMTRKPRLQKKLMMKKLNEYRKVETALLEITKYKSPPWLLCAMYRIAQAKQNVVQVIQNMPLPRIPGFRWTEDAKDVYKEKLDQAYITPLEDQAKALYQKTVERSQQLHFENDCTNKAYEALHMMDPNIPLPKKSHIQKKFETFAPMPLISSLKKKEPKKKSQVGKQKKSQSHSTPQNKKQPSKTKTSSPKTSVGQKQSTAPRTTP